MRPKTSPDLVISLTQGTALFECLYIWFARTRYTHHETSKLLSDIEWDVNRSTHVNRKMRGQKPQKIDGLRRWRNARAEDLGLLVLDA